jgi:site-specific DNA recombinase
MGSKKWTNKKQVVAYCRVSTLEQKKNGYGIDIQIRDVTLFAGLQNLLVQKFYKDEGESGIKEERQGLRRLLRDCQAGRIEVIILPSLDRLSREVRIAENLFHEFQKLSIKILIADMPQYNGERKDILIRQILEAIAEENRREIIQRLWKGRQERIRKGLFPGGNLPYGYARKDGAILIDAHEAEIVKAIFALAGQGRPGKAIADVLNGRGHVRRNGKPWTQRQVCRTLLNEKLYQGGIVHYGEATGENSSLIILDKKEKEGLSGERKNQ